jgi:hypothetical protein
MNAIDAHKDELEELLVNLSHDAAVSGTGFVTLVDAYITRLDANCPDISARVNPSPAQINRRIKYGTNIDSELRALLRATQDSKTPRHVFRKISRCGPQARFGHSSATDTRQTFQASAALPRQRPLSNKKMTVK